MIPPVPLGTWPTPVEAAPRLAARLGLAELWFKRDDLTGLGGGGNKIRKLQHTCAQAIAVGAGTVITSGAPQSNHARLTAAAAARLGLSCVLVLAGPPPPTPRGNLLLDALAGAQIVWAGDRPLAEVVAVEAERRSAYVIPFGGTSTESVQAYVDCARELRTQLPAIDGAEVVVALGSGGSMAGLVRELGAQRVIGVDVGAVPDPRATVAGLLVGEVEPNALRIDGSQVGAGYRTLTDAVRAALEITAGTEGIFLDPTYTGRAMAALLAGSFPRGDRLVFVHTGGLPGLFGHPEL
ncbi:pyridoxal-phosphate dependent enzyme [Micromonospora parva]|uniref:pyridoxal-phosphate dependent enzyme n=1 Tax=Micromonospora parva TaxID=1464048 RepID=UPI0004C280C7|nr:pyridoxal-phosphate dependent enzyme [Micromonospora parva]